MNHFPPSAMFAAVFLAAGIRAAAADPGHGGAEPPPSAGSASTVKVWFVGGGEALAKEADKIMVGVQHWYADQFDGRTFSFEPARAVGSYSEIPGGGKGFRSAAGGSLPGVVNVIFDAGVHKGYPEGFGSSSNGGGRATLGLGGVLDPIVHHRSNNRLGTGGEGRGWYVAIHEIGHAFGLGHSGAAGDVMAPPAMDANPYDPSRNKVVLGDHAKKVLDHSPFLRAENNPGHSDEDVRTILNGGKIPPPPNPGGPLSPPAPAPPKPPAPPPPPVPPAGGPHPPKAPVKSSGSSKAGHPKAPAASPAAPQSPVRFDDVAWPSPAPSPAPAPPPPVANPPGGGGKSRKTPAKSSGSARFVPPRTTGKNR